MDKVSKIVVNDVEINISTHNEDDFISLTDMASAKEGDVRAADVIKNWVRTRTAIEFLGVWEQLYNPNFNMVEFDHFRRQAGLPTFVLSLKKWVEKTNAIGVYSKSGRYGGTYAHKDIAFEFGSAISPVFKLYIIKEYQRLKQTENDTYNLEWDVKRILSKVNYHFQTDAIQKHIIPKSSLPPSKKGIEYAKEAEILNYSLFGCTSKEWRKVNPELVKKGLNIRDVSSINELIVMSNLESFNAEMIKKGISKKERFNILKESAKEQLEKLKDMDLIKAVRKQNDKTYIDAQEVSGDELLALTNKNILEKNKENLSKFNQNLKKGLNFNPKEDKK